MFVKVCGITQASQVQQLDEIDGIHFVGSIYYSGSKRYTEKTLPPTMNSTKVGVFVNESFENILRIGNENKLKFVQLHGNESPKMCLKLSPYFTVIKAISVDDSFDFKTIELYENVVDFFLFDTKTASYGGSGRKFNWEILKNYSLNTPFILSGGISFTDIELLKKITHQKFIGIDINSQFEYSPGIKNIELIKKFIHELND